MSIIAETVPETPHRVSATLRLSMTSGRNRST